MLKIENVNVFYDGLQALYSVSLEIQAEEFVCILGPNGAGKSTLLQTIAGMLAPNKGAYLLQIDLFTALSPLILPLLALP